jgi:WD40 repeat protein
MAPGSRALRAPMAPQLRDHDRYEILGEHGRGGLGRVSRAHDRELGRDIAIKELISRGHLGEVRFLREALITARLEHPGIVPVYEAGRWADGTPFYAMKLVSGRPLRDLIAERKTVDERIGLLHHAIAVADAIAYAHGRGIIHRDLKPANVIVGEFGETVVIDWGLAKDLTAAAEPAVGGGPFRERRDDGLTSAGAVLGTPAYMAPEQERGEPVDQRADVFAIGAMLWELCSLHKLSPGVSGQHRRVLRTSGIDADLTAIIEKALDPDPARRYPDAGALAADLRAFKAGVRIAARRYSPWALLAHWMRRHRALAISTAVVAGLGVIGIAIYVRNIAVERDRADAAFARSEAARDDLTLEHAELLLHSDPTAAVTALSGYHGGDALRRHRLLAEATGLGVAARTLEPHGDTIRFLLGDRTGAIVSLGEDGRIQRTQGEVSTALASDVSPEVRMSYAPPQRLLAYTTTPSGIAVLRIDDRTLLRIPDVNARSLRWSPDGSRLAALTDHGELVVWSIGPSATEIHRTALPGVSRVLFMTPARVLAQRGTEIRALAIEASGGPPSQAAIPTITTLDARPDAVLVGTSDGNVELLSATLAVAGTAPLCRARVNSVQFVAGRDRFAFACSNGDSGLVTFDSALSRLETVDTFPTRGYTYARTDPTGRYVTLVDESRTAYLYDLETRIVHRHEGHAGPPTYIAAPSAEFPHVLTGDANGTVRLWDPPAMHTRVALQAPVPLYELAFGSDSKTLLANGSEHMARGVNLETGALFSLSGDTGVLKARTAPDGSSMLTFGYDGTVRVWRARDLALIRSFKAHEGLIGEVDYATGRRIVSVGDDGRLLEWSPDGTDTAVLFRCGSPLRRLEVLASSGHVIVDDARGAVWDVAPDRSVIQVRAAAGSPLALLRASPDGKFLAIGTDGGTVVVYETASWRVVRSWTGDGGIRQIAFDPLDRDLMIAAEARHSQLGHVHLLALQAQRIGRWDDVRAAVRDVAYAPDGDTLGFVCADGGAWLYSLRRDVWAYANSEHADTLAAAFSADGRLFASADLHGSVIVHQAASMLDLSEAVQASHNITDRKHSR